MRRRQKTQDIVTYCSNQQYLSSRTYVVGEPEGDTFDLPAGTYLYRFQIQLPSDLPSSFEGQYGNIRYEVVVRIDRPFKFDNIFTHPFTVITPLNLNSDPTYKVSALETLNSIVCEFRITETLLHFKRNGNLNFDQI